MAYCTQADLEIALGGASVLVQLADHDGDAVADTAVVTDYLDSGAALVRSVLEVKHEPETIAALDSDSLRLLRDCNKWMSAEIAWLEGGHGQAVPDRVATQAERMRGVVNEIRTGDRRLGRVANQDGAALSQPVGVVDHDPIATALITPSTAQSGISVAAFKLGFR